MVQLFPDWEEGFGDIRVIDDPAQLGIAFAGYHNIDLETMAVQPPTFVRFREMRQQVRGFELKGFS